MKIKKYKDLQKWTDGPNKDDGKLDQEIEDFISNFRNSLDDSVSDWISVVCKETKLKEYKDCDMENPKPENVLKFIDKKGLKYYKQFVEFSNEIEKLNLKISKLEENQDEVRDRADSELLLKFQEELLEKDFEKFYEFFIDPGNDGEWLTDVTLTDVHPDLLNRYGDEFFEQFKHIPASKSYNI